MTQSNVSLNTQQDLKNILKTHEIEHFGLVSLQKPLSLAIYKDWIAEGLHGDMEYLERHLPQKENPQLLLPQAQSALVLGFHYVPHPRAQRPLKGLKVAKYALGEDYHNWVKEKLELIVSDLQAHYPVAKFMVATDSSPVMERDLAYQAGLGWFGKNTCLIHQKRGSYFLIGEIYTTITLSYKPEPHLDMCGTCERCMVACPTQAILSDKRIDARRCISYLTIESKTIPSEELRSKMGDHFFGCDICQDVCPWNNKVFSATLANTQKASDLSGERTDLLADVKFILTTSAKKLEKVLCHTPLMRARGFGLKRNALIIAGNLKLSELRPYIEPLTTDTRLGSLALWTLSKL